MVSKLRKLITLWKELSRKIKNPTFQGELAQALMTFIFSILVTRFMGIEIYGKLIILYTISNFFSDIIGVRSNEVIVYYWNRNSTQNNMFLTLSILTDIMIGISMFCVIYFFADYTSSFLGTANVSKDNIKLISVYTLLLYMRGSFWGVLQAERKFRALAFLKSAEIAIRIVLAIVIILYSRVSIENLIYITIFSAFLTYIFSLFSSCFLIKYKPDFGFLKSPEISLEYFYFTGQNFLSTVIKAGNKQIDSLIVAKYLGQGSIAIYDLVKKFCLPINLITNTTTINSFPVFVDYRHKRKKDIYLYIRDLDRKLIVICSLGLVVIALSLPFIELIYNIEISFLLFVFLLFATLVNQFLWWTRSFSIVFNQKLSIYINLYSSISSLTILVVLTSNFGFVGLICGLIFIRLSTLFIYNFYLNKYTNNV